MTVIYDPEAHEPLTETLWDEARIREWIASIVEEAESALSDGFWPNHPLDDDQEPRLPEGLTTVYLGSAGMLWALHRLGSKLDLPSLVEARCGAIASGRTGTRTCRAC